MATRLVCFGQEVCQMKIRVVIEHDSEAKSYAVYCPELPGCTSCGETEEEAVKNIREAVDLYLEPAPGEVPQNGKVIELVL